VRYRGYRVLHAIGDTPPTAPVSGVSAKRYPAIPPQLQATFVVSSIGFGGRFSAHSVPISRRYLPALPSRVTSEMERP